MDIEDEIKQIKNAIHVVHRELFQANKIPARFYELRKRISELENRVKELES